MTRRPFNKVIRLNIYKKNSETNKYILVEKLLLDFKNGCAIQTEANLAFHLKYYHGCGYFKITASLCVQIGDRRVRLPSGKMGSACPGLRPASSLQA